MTGFLQDDQIYQQSVLFQPVQPFIASLHLNRPLHPTSSTKLPHTTTFDANQFRLLQSTEVLSRAAPNSAPGATGYPSDSGFANGGWIQIADVGKFAAESYALKKLLERENASEMIDTIAGTVSALVATIIVYPLDNIRTKISASPKRCLSPTQVFEDVVRNEGITGLYKGLSTALIGVCVSWFSYNLSRSLFKLIAQKWKKRDPLNNSEGFILRTLALFVSVVVSTPVWLANTRITLYGNEGTSNSLVRSLMKIYTEEGVRGLFSGLTPSLLLSITPAIQFAILGKLKSFLNAMRKKSNHSIFNGNNISSKMNIRHQNGGFKKPNSILEYFFIGLISKMAASFLSYPYRVLRTRVQSKYTPLKSTNSSFRCTMKILEHEGVQGFFKGFTSKLLADAISTGVMLLMYEKLLKLFKNVLK